VLVLQAGPAQLGALAALSSGTGALVGLVAGGRVDRSRRRPLLIATDLFRAALLLTIPAAAVLGLLSIGQLYLVAVLAGAATTVFELAAHAYLPALIGPAALIAGNSRLSTTDSVAEIAGPGLTGVLVQVLTAPFAIAVDAASYLASAALLARIRSDEPLVAKSEAMRRQGNLAAGLAACFGHALIRPLLLMRLTAGFFGSFFAALYIVFAVTELHLGPALLGITIAVGGVGGLAGAALLPPLARRHRFGPLLLAASFGSGLATLLIPLAHGDVVIAMPCLMAAQLLGDALAVAAMIQADSLRQTVVPPALMGRAGAIFQAGTGFASVAGALIGGALAAAIGIRTTLLIAALGLAAAPLWGLASPLRRLGELPRTEREEPDPG
jgi:predicted MFS family arabinose efflux permease